MNPKFRRDSYNGLTLGQQSTFNRRALDQVTRLKEKCSARTRICLPHFQASTGSEIFLPLVAEKELEDQSLSGLRPLA